MRGLCCIPLSSTKSHETVHLQHHQMNIHRKYQHQQQAGNPPFGKMIWKDALINCIKSPSDHQKNQNGQTKFPLPIFQGQPFIREVSALSTRKLIGKGIFKKQNKNRFILDWLDLGCHHSGSVFIKMEYCKLSVIYAQKCRVSGRGCMELSCFIWTFVLGSPCFYSCYFYFCSISSLTDLPTIVLLSWLAGLDWSQIQSLFKVLHPRWEIRGPSKIIK